MPMNPDPRSPSAPILTGAIPQTVLQIRTALANYDPPKPKADFTPAEGAIYRGWLLPYLLKADAMTWRRWEHWAEVMTAGQIIPDRPIPRIEFEPMALGTATYKHLEKCLNLVPRYGEWRTWSNWNNFDYFCDWLLYGFGHLAELPKEPEGCDGACARLYQFFNVVQFLAYPSDYFGDILAENAHGRHLGFYPTPLCICTMMAAMTFGDEDCRAKSFCDPCIGTGRFPLVASNYTYRIFGMDINPTVIKCTLINGYLYAPWLVKPFPFLDRVLTDATPEESAALSEKMVELAPAHAAPYLENTEPDPVAQTWASPIRVRRRRAQAEDPNQLALLVK